MFWTCPKCKKRFKHSNQAHSCARVEIDEHFKNRAPHVRATFDKLMAELQKFGRVTINSVKNSIQVKAATTFLSIRPKKDYLAIEFLLSTEVDEFPVYKTFRVSKNRVAHSAVLERPREVNAQLMRWLRCSYKLVRN